MLSVNKSWRKRGIASTLVRKSMEVMKENRVEEVILETEYDNAAALSLYESLGFIREKRLFRFYLNGKDAFRLVLEIPVSDDDDEFQSDKSESLSSPRRPPYRAIQISPYSDDDDDESSR
jgi:peptide alpha-N-acetyltransferase